MKRYIYLICTLIAGAVSAQELQLHYDMDKDREYLTSTFEIFKPDSLGSTFAFIDVNYDREDGASLAYFEIARKFNIPNKFIKGLNAHIEYNDGFLITNDKEGSPATPVGIPINRAWLVGVGFPVKIGNVTVHTTYMYKNIKDSHGIDGQFTAVAAHNILNNKVTLRGFMDIWSEDKFGSDDKHVVFITEPQVLYNISNKFSAGSEIEISKNFVDEDWHVYPTVMIKWNL